MTIRPIFDSILGQNITVSPTAAGTGSGSTSTTYNQVIAYNLSSQIYGGTIIPSVAGTPNIDYRPQLTFVL